jgi:hypothetical protein
MNMQLSLFDAQPDFDQSIRRTDHNGIVYFSLVDIMEQFADSKQDARKYWNDTKKRLHTDGFEVSEKIRQLKLTAPDGKQRLTDCADGQTCLRIVQSIPSPKAEPIRQWLAQLGYERLEEAANPSLGVDRALERASAAYRKQGKDTQWIETRFDGKLSRKEFTDALQRVCRGDINYAKATDTEYKGVFGRTAKDIKTQTGAKNARDAMTRPALHLLGAIEATVTQMLGDRDFVSSDEALHIINEVASIHRPIAHQIQQLLGLDIATGQPLFGRTQ